MIEYYTKYFYNLKQITMKHEIIVAKSEQPPIPGIREEAKTIYYLVIGEGEKKVILHVGKLTYEKINKLNEKPAK